MGRCDHPPYLQPPELARLAEVYRRDQAAWAASPKIAETVARVARLQRAAGALAEVLGELRPIELRLVGLDADEAGARLALVDGLAEACAAALLEVDRLGGRTGGNRRLASLVQPGTPRWRLAAAVRDALLAVGHACPSRRVVTDVTSEVLALAGEGADGLADVVRTLPRLGRTAADQP